MRDWREDPRLLICMMMSYPQWRRVILEREDGVEWVIDRLMSDDDQGPELTC